VSHRERACAIENFNLIRSWSRNSRTSRSPTRAHTLSLSLSLSLARARARTHRRHLSSYIACRKNNDAITEWQMVAANVVARYFCEKQPVARTCIELSERINSRKGASYHKSLVGFLGADRGCCRWSYIKRGLVDLPARPSTQLNSLGSIPRSLDGCDPARHTRGGLTVRPPTPESLTHSDPPRGSHKSRVFLLIG